MVEEYGIKKIRGNYYKLDVNGKGYKEYRNMYFNSLDNAMGLKVLLRGDDVVIMALFYGWGWRGYKLESEEKQKIKDLGIKELMIKYKEMRTKNVLGN